MLQVDVQSPEEYLGEIIGDINSRRGQVRGSIPPM